MKKRYICFPWQYAYETKRNETLSKKSEMNGSPQNKLNEKKLNAYFSDGCLENAEGKA